MGLFGWFWRSIKVGLLRGAAQAEGPDGDFDSLRRELEAFKEPVVQVIHRRNQLRAALQEQTPPAADLRTRLGKARREGDEDRVRQLQAEVDASDGKIEALRSQLQQAEQESAQLMVEVKEKEAHVRQRAEERLRRLSGR